MFLDRGVAQLVERDVRDVEAGGSNPLTPTIIINKNRQKTRIYAGF